MASKGGNWRVLNEGVGVRLGILKARGRLLVGDPERELGVFARDSFEACRETNGLAAILCFGGEPGASTVTSGGERGGDRGPIDTGRSFGVLDRDTGPLLSPSGSKCALGWLAVKLWFGLGMSRDAPLLYDSAVCTFNALLVGPSEGDGSGGGGFDLIIFSKWLRREDTGFYRYNFC